MAYVYMHTRLDTDDGEESFLRRIDEDLKKLKDEQNNQT